VRILVRPNSPYQPLVELGAEAMLGDLRDRPTLEPVCAGVETLITTASAGSRGGSDTPESVDGKGNRTLIDAARAAGVRQFIFASTIAADEQSPVPLLRAKGETEAYLQAGGITFTILAATTLMDIMLPLVVGGPALAGQPVTLVGEGRRRHSFLAAGDFAAFAVAAVGHPDAINRRIVIGGPEPLSLRDVVAAYERSLGHSIPIESVDPGELLPNLPPVPGLAEVISGMLALMETFDSPIEMSETAQRFGVRLTTLEEFVAAQLMHAGQSIAV
jgi:NADH dehydrogenase